jgi:hypothetical protein
LQRFDEARRIIEEAQERKVVESEAALIFAMAGDTARAERLAQDLRKRFPLDTQMQFLWLLAIQAHLALNKKYPTSALTTLQAASSIELEQIQFVINISCLYPTYVRGEAFLAAGQGSAAAPEFQKILDHSGIVWNCWTVALAHLGVARANALQAENFAGSRRRSGTSEGARRIPTFPHALERRRPRHSHPEANQAEYARLQ